MIMLWLEQNATDPGVLTVTHIRGARKVIISGDATPPSNGPAYTQGDIICGSVINQNDADLLQHLGDHQIMVSLEGKGGPPS